MGCAETALKTLPPEVLSALSATCAAASAALQVLSLRKQALAAYMQISMAPLLAKQAAINTITQNLRDSVKIIPSATVALCPELGLVNVMVEKALTAPLEAVLNVGSQIDRLASQSAEVAAEQANIDTAIAFFTTLKASIVSALTV